MKAVCRTSKAGTFDWQPTLPAIGCRLTPHPLAVFWDNVLNRLGRQQQ